MEMRPSDLTSPLPVSELAVTDDQMPRVPQMEAALSHAVQRDQATKKSRRATTMPRGRDPLFQSDGVQTWTVSDQMRIGSIDRLQSRTLEYHNNVHQRTEAYPGGNVPAADDVVAEVLHCTRDTPRQPVSVTSAMIDNVFRTHAANKEADSSTVVWINMLNLSLLPRLVDGFGLRPLQVTGFQDLRCHSGVVQCADGSCLISLCHFHMSRLDFHVQMFKLYVYMNKGVCVTYTAELMPDELDLDDEESAVPEVTVCSTMLSRWPRLSRDICNFGPFFLFYKLADECLVFQDPIMEFFSRTLFFFKGQIKIQLSHHEKINFMKKMHITMSGIHLLDRNTQKLVYIFEQLSSKVSNPKILPLISSNILSTEVLPYMFDLQDSYHFADDCLNSLETEARILHDIMENISTLRANNNAMVLSLIATIFLPVTFLTGVFGMNFQEDGGYTIGVVNDPWGPLVFYVMCCAVFIASCFYFLSMGWLEPYPIYRYFLKCIFGKNRVRGWEENGQLGTVTNHRVSTVYSPELRRAAQAAATEAINPMGADYAAGSSAVKTNVFAASSASPSMDRSLFGRRTSASNSIYQEAVREELRRAEEARRKRGASANTNASRQHRHSSYLDTAAYAAESFSSSKRESNRERALT